MIDILFEKTDIKMFTVSHFQYNDAAKKLIEKKWALYMRELRDMDFFTQLMDQLTLFVTIKRRKVISKS